MIAVSCSDILDDAEEDEMEIGDAVGRASRGEEDNNKSVEVDREGVSVGSEEDNVK